VTSNVAMVPKNSSTPALPHRADRPRGGAALAAGQVAYYQRRLASVEAAQDEASRHPEWAYRFLAVPLGRATLRAGLEFWQAIEADPPGPEPARSARRGRQGDQ
jgi:hypothetical protein